MSEQRIGKAGNSDSRTRWAALDSRNERLVDISDRLLLDTDRDKDRDRGLKAAS